VSPDLSRRRFLVSAAAGAASLALTDVPPATAASPLPSLSEVLAGDAGSMTVVNYATYVTDRGRVDASRTEHQVYADALREHGRLAMGGPLLGDDGRPSGVLLVYEVASRQQAETLAQSDPFVQQGAIANYRLAEWNVRDANMALLAAALVPEDRRASSREARASGATPAAADAPIARLYVSYVKYASDSARVERVRAAHQSYAQAIKANGGLVMAGPFAGDSGALFIYRARSKDEARALVQKDPYHAERVVESYALSEWRLFGLNAGLIQGP
jgi:uncharacterized protein YciI